MRTFCPCPVLLSITYEHNDEYLFYPAKDYEFDFWLSRLPDVRTFICNLTPDFGHEKAQHEGWAFSKSIFNFWILRGQV